MRLAVAALALVLAGCATDPVVIYRPCREDEPERPAMPTEALSSATATPDEFAHAAIPEIDLREAYEIELRTALRNCKRN